MFSEIVEQRIEQAVAMLRAGNTIVHQTDTVPGIAADATQADAIAKVYKVKQRDLNRPLLLLCKDIEMLSQYVTEIPPLARDIMERFPELSITIIYPKAKNLPENLPAANGSIGIRIPKHKETLALIKRLNRPIVSTSANLSGHPTPVSMQNIQTEVLKLVDYVLILPSVMGAEERVSSWIVKIQDHNIQIFREGKASEDFSNWIQQQRK